MQSVPDLPETAVAQAAIALSRSTESTSANGFTALELAAAHSRWGE